jgi:hypothetical protein
MGGMSEFGGVKISESTEMVVRDVHTYACLFFFAFQK